MMTFRMKTCFFAYRFIKTCVSVYTNDGRNEFSVAWWSPRLQVLSGWMKRSVRVQVWSRQSHLSVKCALLLLSGLRFALLTEAPWPFPKHPSSICDSPQHVWPMHTTAHDIRGPFLRGTRFSSLVSIRTAQAAPQRIDLSAGMEALHFYKSGS